MQAHCRATFVLLIITKIRKPSPRVFRAPKERSLEGKKDQNYVLIVEVGTCSHSLQNFRVGTGTHYGKLLGPAQTGYLARTVDLKKTNKLTFLSLSVLFKSNNAMPSYYIKSDWNVSEIYFIY